MTFQSSYAKLLFDPELGSISKRREHMKQMYIEGMKELRDAHVSKFGYTHELFEDEIKKVEAE